MTLALTQAVLTGLTTGRDDNRDNLANDRPPGVVRNTLQGPGAAILDLRWSKEFGLKDAKERNDDGPAITIAVAAFNVLNRTNYAGFVGNLSSPFCLPVASRPARHMQLTVGLSFKEFPRCLSSLPKKSKATGIKLLTPAGGLKRR
jgi:hypothetical protein